MMDYKLLRVFALACLLLLNLSGCGSGCRKLFLENEGIKPFPPKTMVLESSHTAADALVDQAGVGIDAKRPLIATTFVNIDDLEYAASFGRAIAKQVASRFTQRGLKVVEMLFRHDVLIKQNSGEFMLSRDLQNISAAHNAQAVIVGTYAVARNTIYVNTRVIRATDSVVLSSYDYSLPKDDDLKFMLKERSSSVSTP